MPPAGYKANAFSPDTGTRVLSGSLRVLPDRVEFESETSKGNLPLAGLQLRAGGHNNEQLFFEHPAHPRWSIYSSDEQLIDDPILSLDPRFQAVLQTVAKRRKAP